MCGACSTSGNDKLEALDLDKMIILKLILKK
jgi:hypothetical protein